MSPASTAALALWMTVHEDETQLGLNSICTSRIWSIVTRPYLDVLSWSLSEDLALCSY